MLGFITKGKDAALGKVARLILNQFEIDRYATVTSLTVTSEAKEIQCVLVMKGEEKPLEVQARFQIAEEGSGEKTIVLDAVSASREWLNLLIADHLTTEMRRIPIPPSAYAILKALKL